MRSIILAVGLCFMVAGCNGEPEKKDPASVYEAVFADTLKASKGTGFYVFVDGKDPAPELLNLLQQKWPELQPGSKAPADKANRLSVGNLKWIDRDTAEVQGTFSNGMDGRANEYRVVRKNGVWVIESIKLKAIS